MNLAYPKLPLEAAPRLKECLVDTVAPFVLMVAPMYVFMPKNERFVSVKAPLDFFTPEELEKLKSVGRFYVPDYVDQIVPYRSAGRSLRSLLSFKPQGKELGLTPFELSDAVLRLVGPLWRKNLTIDPYFVTVLVNEMFDAFPEEVLNQARETDVDNFELSLYRSSVAVFLAMHLGRTSLEELKLLRDQVFEMSSKQKTLTQPISEWEELIMIVQAALPSSKIKCLSGETIKAFHKTVARRLENRFERVANDLVPKTGSEFVSFIDLLADELKTKEHEPAKNQAA